MKNLLKIGLLTAAFCTSFNAFANDDRLSLKVDNDKAVLSSSLITEFFSPVLTKEKDMITLNFKNQANGAVNVFVENEHNEELFNKSYKEANLTQKFDVSKTNAKVITFTITYKGKEYIETFKLR